MTGTMCQSHLSLPSPPPAAAQHLNGIGQHWGLIQIYKIKQLPQVTFRCLTSHCPHPQTPTASSKTPTRPERVCQSQKEATTVILISYQGLRYDPERVKWDGL